MNDLVRVNFDMLGTFCIRPDTVDRHAVDMIESMLDGRTSITGSPFPTIRPNRVLDIGGFIGTVSRAIKLLHPDADIIAIEANPSTFAVLEANSISGTAYTAVHAGVVGQSVPCVWSVSHSTENHDMDYVVFSKPDFPPEYTNVTVDEISAVRICDVLDSAGWGTVDFVKIDIECGEYDLFSSESENWLSRITSELHIEFHNTNVYRDGYINALRVLNDAKFICIEMIPLYGRTDFLATRWLPPHRV